MAKLKQWARSYKKCQRCGTIKSKHKGGGYCQGCYGSLDAIKERDIKRKAERKELLQKSTVPNRKAEPINKNLGGRPEEWTTERIEKEAEELINWSLGDELVLETFGLYRNPPYIRAVMYELGNKNELFRDALMVAKERIRARRESGAYKGEYNASTMQFTHGFYDRDNNHKDLSFTAYKDERKKVDDTADISKQKQALSESKQFVEEAKEKLAKKKKVKK